MSCHMIAITNQKGGVGKTTTCANLGVGLANEGKRVLLVDCDPQGSLSVSRGQTQPDKLPITIASLLGKTMMDDAVAIKEGILRHLEGVDYISANIELSGLEVSLVNAMSREKVLKQYLDTVKQAYDYILLDCMPSLGLLTINCLAAADSVLIPATIIMVDSNIQRENILPSERAMAFKLKLEAIKRQGARTDLTCDQVGHKLKARELVAKDSGESAVQVSQEGKLTFDVMSAIMSEEKKPEPERMTLTGDKLHKYFPKTFTPQQMEETILKLLEGWAKKRQQDLVR